MRKVSIAAYQPLMRFDLKCLPDTILICAKNLNFSISWGLKNDWNDAKLCSFYLYFDNSFIWLQLILSNKFIDTKLRRLFIVKGEHHTINCEPHIIMNFSQNALGEDEVVNFTQIRVLKLFAFSESTDWQCY
jgi:hypothetical protein